MQTCSALPRADPRVSKPREAHQHDFNRTFLSRFSGFSPLIGFSMIFLSSTVTSSQKLYQGNLQDKQLLTPDLRQRPHLFHCTTRCSGGQTALISDFTLTCLTKTHFLVLLYVEEGFFGKSKSVDRFYGHLHVLFIAHYLFSILILKKIDHCFVVCRNHIFFKSAYAVATSLVSRMCSFLLFELYFMRFNCTVYLHGDDRALILLQKNKRINE